MEPPKLPLDEDGLRRLLIEVAETLEAVIVAMQTEREGGDAAFVMREAVHRVVQLRQHIDPPSAPPP